MNNLNNYAELEDRRRFLTNSAQTLKSEIAELKKKKKYKDSEKKEKELEKSLKELKDIMIELAYVKSKEAKKLNSPPQDIDKQLDNEVIYVEGVYALVMKADGTFAYTIQQEGTVKEGDLAFDADLHNFETRSIDLQRELIKRYRESRERKFGI